MSGDRWASARSLQDLGRLTAEWFEGTVDRHPAYDRPDDETSELIPWLASLNRAGLVTECSQPGRGGDYPQRAFVSGWCSEPAVSSISLDLFGTDLVVIARPCDASVPIEIPISLGDEINTTITFAWTKQACLTCDWGNRLNADALEALYTGWYVEIFDPIWGRRDYLWTKLLTAFEKVRVIWSRWTAGAPAGKGSSGAPAASVIPRAPANPNRPRAG